MEPRVPNSSKVFLGERRHAAKTRGGFCLDPVRFPALQPTLETTTASSSSSSSSFSTTMGACYPKCMNVGDDDEMWQPEDETTSTSIGARDTTGDETELRHTCDVEELGLATVPPDSQQQEKGIVVDYEDSDEDHVELRDPTAACALSACGPLTGGSVAAAAATELNSGRLARRRSRCSSLEMASLRGTSVGVFQQNIKHGSPPSTSETDADEEMRCSEVHKLCMCEVKLHHSLESCWLVSSSQVYDVTGLVTAHPGGVRSILRKAGGPDCARDMKFHTKKARKMMEKCFIGKLEPCGDDVNGAGETNCSVM